MTDVISFQKAKERKNFDRHQDPCSSCDEKTSCILTCDRAQIWWGTFAELFKEGKA